MSSDVGTTPSVISGLELYLPPWATAIIKWDLY